MLSIGLKKEAISIHKNAIKKYEGIYKQCSDNGECLYEKRTKSVTLVLDVESFLRTISNAPKDFEVCLNNSEVERNKFKQTEDFAREQFDDAVKDGVMLAGGIATGTAVATLAPTAAMWVATTYGVSSTGVAISALSGAAATNASLAWLGGGTLAAGGAGVAGGQAFLVLAGPVGWSIVGASTVATAVKTSFKNASKANEIVEEAKKITLAGANLKETSAMISNFANETEVLLGRLTRQFAELEYLRNSNYTELSTDEQFKLGTLVNNTFSLSELLNKIVD